jgi:hypothetical protein
MRSKHIWAAGVLVAVAAAGIVAVQWVRPLLDPDSAGAPIVDQPCTGRQDDARIYEIVIADVQRRIGNAGLTRLVVLSSTGTRPVTEQTRDYLRQHADIDEGAFVDFRSRNRAARNITRCKLELQPRPEFVDDRNGARYYPGALTVQLSRIGYSDDGQQAVVSEEHAACPACGEGNYVILRRTSTGWSIVRRVLAWTA